MDKRHYIIIIGAGRSGVLLGNHLSAQGHNVVVIDKRKEALQQLSSDFSGYKVVGDARERRILQEARIEQANYVFVITSYDNVNIMIAQIAKYIFDIEHVIARIDDPAREDLYEEFGIETISPTLLTAKKFLSILHESEG